MYALLLSGCVHILKRPVRNIQKETSEFLALGHWEQRVIEEQALQSLSPVNCAVCLVVQKVLFSSVALGHVLPACLLSCL